jgi:hypothetical protein
MNSFKQLVQQNKESSEHFSSLHEFYGILFQELQDLFDIIRQEPEKRDNQIILDKLVNIATHCECLAEEMELVEISQENDIMDSRSNLLTRLADAVTHGVLYDNLQKTKSKNDSDYINIIIPKVIYSELKSI